MTQQETMEQLERKEINSFKDRSTNVPANHDDGLFRVSSHRIIYGDSEILENASSGEEDEYYLFEGCLGSGEPARLICPTAEDSAEYEVLKQWTDSESMRDLYGKTIPVRKIENGLYKVDGFSENPLGFTPIGLVKKMISVQMMEYKNGLWVVNGFGSLFFYAMLFIFAILPYILLLSSLSITGGLLYIPYAIGFILLTERYNRQSSFD